MTKRSEASTRAIADGPEYLGAESPVKPEREYEPGQNTASAARASCPFGVQLRTPSRS